MAGFSSKVILAASGCGNSTSFKVGAAVCGAELRRMMSVVPSCAPAGRRTVASEKENGPAAGSKALGKAVPVGLIG